MQAATWVTLLCHWARRVAGRLLRPVRPGLGRLSGRLAAGPAADRRQALRPDDHWTARDWAAEVRVHRDEGRRLEYLDHGTGSPVVLLHGLGCCWQWWLECLPALAAHHRVIAVDLPGFGASDPLPTGSGMPVYADAVAGLLRRLGLGDVTLVGHSMGGLVAMDVALHHPELVRKLVLVGSGGAPMSERRLRSVLTVLRIAHATLARPGVTRLLVERRAARRILLRGAMRDPGVMSDELAAVVLPRLDAPAFLDAVAASAAAVRACRPESLVLPTALVWGEHDLFAPLHTAEELLERLPAGRLVVLPGLGHSPMVEAPHLFAEVLLREAGESTPHLSRTGR